MKLKATKKKLLKGGLEEMGIIIKKHTILDLRKHLELILHLKNLLGKERTYF